ncbi:MAG: hypothetical protein V7636_1662 [Actinomycetota bacterium]|jgi:hypothetical protein
MAERRPATRKRSPAGPKGKARADRPFGMAKVVPLDRAEFAPFCDGLGVVATSPLSPLTGLVAAGGAGASRPFEELRAPLGIVADETFRWAMEPLAAPDRILDARVTAYEGAPVPARLYSSRRHGPDWAGLRTAITRDYELLGPYSEPDLGLWLELQLQLTGGNIIPTPWQLMSGEELTFFFGLVDAFKLALHQSFITRRPRPQPLVFRFSDILNAQNLALKSFDRRWLLTAMGELFGVLRHPGGEGVGLPILSAALAEREVRRYVKNGWLAVRDRGKDPLLELDGPLPFLASTLLSWLNIVTLHDIQVTGWNGGTAIAGEEVMVFIVTEAALWGIVSSGLTNASSDVGAVEFGVQTLTVPEAIELARRFLQPLPIDRLPDEVYAAATAPPPPPAPAPAPAAPVAAPARAAANPWTPTHVVPAGGLAAWEQPDPTLAPAATLDPGLDVEVIEHNVSGWAHIVCSNGWSAWVDAARLEEVRS